MTCAARHHRRRSRSEEAIGLALEWRAQQVLPPKARTDLEALLVDLVVTGRKDYNGPLVKASAAAAIAVLDLELPLPGSPARIAKVVAGAVSGRWARDVGLRLAERLAAAPAPVRRGREWLRSLVDRDERFDSSGDVAVEDTRAAARLRPILHELETA
ncbi:hypothetical protein [Prescottella equi]